MIAINTELNKSENDSPIQFKLGIGNDIVKLEM